MGNIKFPIKRSMVSNIRKPMTASDAAAVGDPYWDDVVFLTHFDGIQDSTVFTDESDYNHTIASRNGASLTTVIKVFGTAALSVDLIEFTSTPDSDAFHIGTNQFTIEGHWERTVVGGVGQCLMGKWKTGDLGWMLYYEKTGFLSLFTSVDGTTSLQRVRSAFTMLTDVSYAIAVDRDASNKYRMYVDGNMVGSETAADNITNGGQTLTISLFDEPSPKDGFVGVIDEVRVTIGTARYASDAGYTVATEAFPNS